SALLLSRGRSGMIGWRALRLRRLLLLSVKRGLRLVRTGLKSVERSMLDGCDICDVTRRMHELADRFALLVEHLAGVAAVGRQMHGDRVARETKAHGDVAERRRIEADGEDLDRLIGRTALG